MSERVSECVNVLDSRLAERGETVATHVKLPRHTHCREICVSIFKPTELTDNDKTSTHRNNATLDDP